MPGKFKLNSPDQLISLAADLGVEIPVGRDLHCLFSPVEVQGRIIPNRLVIQPMEGCDGTAGGCPDSLTFRRYRRFAAGGAGLIWVEATAVTPLARANPRQLWLHPGSLEAFKDLVHTIKATATEHHGMNHKPLTVLQLTHSGRYSRPEKQRRPWIAFHDPWLDGPVGVDSDYPIITDDELGALEDEYVQAADLARQAGFDAVDIKACHRYLLSELLAAHSRPGRYGGDLASRARLLLNVVEKIREAFGGQILTFVRLNCYDAHPYPYGWAVDKNDPGKADLSEVLQLIRLLVSKGLSLVNVTAGNPYYAPHVNRPYDTPIVGGHEPREHPLVGVARLLNLARQVQEHFPQLPVVSSGYSWLQHLAGVVAAGSIEAGWATLTGMGRLSIAYPEWPRDLRDTGRLDRRKVCITCSSCTQIMRDGGRSGCVIRDQEIYGREYQEGRWRDAAYVQEMAGQCRNCPTPLCRQGCPAGVEIDEFLAAVDEGRFKQAYGVLRRRNILPELCGWVCPAEVLCEGKCIRHLQGGEAVPIRRIQLFVSKLAREKGWTAIEVEAAGTGRRVAVIGAGPSGLACAGELVRLGHSVSVFDAGDEAVGVAERTIPAERLPAQQALAEARSLLRNVSEDRFSWRRGKRLGRDLSVDDLLADGYDAVFVAVGLDETVASAMAKPRAGVVGVLQFLEDAKSGRLASMPPHVAVIGGGNSAMDAACQALALGARDVYVLYRRSFAELPAWPQELRRALSAGVHLMVLTQPVEYLADDQDRLRGVLVAPVDLGETDRSGRREPIVRQDSRWEIRATLAIEALGQRLSETTIKGLSGVELTAEGLIKVDDFATSKPGVYAGGDAIRGGATVVQAVADGMAAARRIDQALKVGL